MPISKDNMRLIDEGFREYAREAFEKEWDKRRGEWDAVFNEDKTKVMDIVERLRGYDENDLVYKTDMIEAANEIERLRGALKTFADNVRETNAGIDKNWAETVNPLKADNERLRQQNAELLAALKDMNGAGYAIVSIYRAAIAKATGKPTAESE